jgi:hypothetical protein
VEHGEWLMLGHEIWSRDILIMASVPMIFFRDPLVVELGCPTIQVSILRLGLWYSTLVDHEAPICNTI